MHFGGCLTCYLEVFMAYSTTLIPSVHSPTLDTHRGVCADAHRRRPNPPATAALAALANSLRQPTTPFNARVKGGHLFWSADDIITARHVRNVIAITKQLGRNLHINTGTHGSKDGETVVTRAQSYTDKKLKDCWKFALEDTLAAAKANQVSVHIVSSLAPPIHPPGTDVLQAWCFSRRTEAVEGHLVPRPFPSPTLNVAKTYQAALRAVNELKETFGNGVSAKCILYNRLTVPIRFTGREITTGQEDFTVPSFIPPGQYGYWFHPKKCGAAVGASGALDYAPEDKRNEFYSVEWDSPWWRLTKPNSAHVSRFKYDKNDDCYYSVPSTRLRANVIEDDSTTLNFFKLAR